MRKIIEALRKQKPKKQACLYDIRSHFRISDYGFVRCKVTDKDIRYPLISLEDLDYCPRCGQRLLWLTRKE